MRVPRNETIVASHAPRRTFGGTMADTQDTTTSGRSGENRDGRRPVKITVNDFYEDAKEALVLDVLAGEAGLGNEIAEKSLNRPALALTGYFKNFANKRLQLFGIGEVSYLLDQPTEKQDDILKQIMQEGIPGILLANDSSTPGSLLDAADIFHVPVLHSRCQSKELFPEATIRIEQLFAPRISVHASLVDIRGLGVLLVGASGVGKSECTLALIRLGHSLIADDTVVIKHVFGHMPKRVRTDPDTDETIVKQYGSGLEGRPKHPDLGGFMECRGVGFIDVKAIYGVRAVLPKKSVDIVVTLKNWDEEAREKAPDEDRTGLDRTTYEILGQQVPHFVLHVRPGRDIAQLVEVCAMVHALRQTGYDCARHFNERIIEIINKDRPKPYPLIA